LPAGGDQASGDSTLAVSSASFETCSGLLTLDEVQIPAGCKDIEMDAQNVNSGTQDSNGSGIDTMCKYEYIAPEVVIGGPTQLRVSGPSLTITGILFGSGESAAAHYQFGLENIQLMNDATSAGSDVAEGIVGNNSYLLTVDAEGVGSITNSNHR
jgi:hypothetical protein